MIGNGESWSMGAGDMPHRHNDMQLKVHYTPYDRLSTSRINLGTFIMQDKYATIDWERMKLKVFAVLRPRTMWGATRVCVWLSRRVDR